MKYKVGDKVHIEKSFSYRNDVTITLEKYNYIATIKDIIISSEGTECYNMEEVNHAWEERYIEGLYEELIHDPINTRFEILDL